MLKLLKGLFYLALLAVVGLIAYAYLGPMLGADFSAPTQEVRVPVDLNAQ